MRLTVQLFGRSYLTKRGLAVLSISTLIVLSALVLLGSFIWWAASN